MPKVIFVRTYLPPKEEFGTLSKFGFIEIPNGIYCLAAVTKQHGYDTEIIDAPLLQIENDKLADLILSKNPKYVGISACTVDVYLASELADKLKKISPELTVIAGGSHLSAVPKETMQRFLSFDIGVIGEGEKTIIELLNFLEGNDYRNLHEVDGIIFREKGNLFTTKPQKFIENLDSLPLPAWDLLPDLKRHYFAPSWTEHSGGTVSIVTSRGCPHQCIFCDRSVFGNKCRFHSAEYVLNMLKYLHIQCGVDNIRILDDNFLLNKKRVIKICDLIITNSLYIVWSCLGRPDISDIEILYKMKEAGCCSISFGVESGSQKILDFEKKNVSLDAMENAVSLTRKAGIRAQSFNIIGHPMESIDTIRQTIDFNKRIGVDDCQFTFMTPFPGSELYQIAEQYGTFDNDWKKMSEFKEPVFIPHGLTKEDLISWDKRAYLSFYLRPRVVFFHISRIRSINTIKVIVTGAIVLITWAIIELFEYVRRICKSND